MVHIPEAVLDLQVVVVQIIAAALWHGERVADAVANGSAHIGRTVKSVVGVKTLFEGREKAVRDLIVPVAFVEHCSRRHIGRHGRSEEIDRLVRC